MAKDPTLKDDDDELAFELGDGVELLPPSPQAELEALTNLAQTETGAYATFAPADIDRKGFSDPVSGLDVLIPNEDAYAVNMISIPENDDPSELLHRSMTYVDGLYRSREDGSTLTSALIMDGKLYTAHMGDSPVLKITIDPAADPDNAVIVEQVTRDHVAANQDEQKLLPDPSLVCKDDKGRSYVYNEQKTSGVMVTRALGDREKKLNHTPELNTLDLSADVKAGKQVFVVVGSDGIMEHTNVEHIQQLLQIMNAQTHLETGRGLKADEIALLMTTYRYNPFSLDGVEFYKRNDDTTLVVQPVTADMLHSKSVGGKKEARLITLGDGHNYRLELTSEGNIAFDGEFNHIPKYETPLSQAGVASMQRFMAAPHLMQDSKILRQ